MKRTSLIVAALAACLLSGCGLFDQYMDFAKLPRNDAAGVAAATTAALETPDLDLDGNVNGVEEWEAFIRTWVQTYQAAK